MKNEIILEGNCLYTPQGAAREYAAVGCNFYRGCPFQCRYCYNRKGMTAKVMGVDHGVLKDCFTNRDLRPKKYREISDDNYAMRCFVEEFRKHEEYLKQTGVFFSFSTDPMLSETHLLTLRAASFCAHRGVSVTILTKSVFPFQLLDEWFGHPESTGDDHFKEYVSFGFTLTGRDDVEEEAARSHSSNAERIGAMRRLDELGYRTWASIEPIVDFDSSYRMIEQTVGFCRHYKIGLMSKRGKEYPPYDKTACASFIRVVTDLMFEYYVPGQSFQGRRTVYWKESIRKFVADDAISMAYIWNSLCSVSRDWRL